MIIPDINLLVYAYNADAPHHRAAKAWWERLMSGYQTVGIPWIVAHGFIRLMTHPRVLERPLRPETALRHVRSWIEWPSVQIIEPGRRHLDILAELFAETGIAGNITTDAVLAALAVEHQCEIHSNDLDFGRFTGLRWINPLSDLRSRQRGGEAYSSPTR